MRLGGLKVKPRKEKAFAYDLLEKKLEYYLPMYTKVTKRSDGKNGKHRLYFEKDVVEKASRTIKRITRFQPIMPWLYNRLTGHVFICHCSHLLL